MDQATTDRGLGNDGSRSHANSCNLSTMDLERMTMGLGRVTLDHGLDDDGSRVGDNRSHADDDGS